MSESEGISTPQDGVDVVATAELSETAKELASKQDTSEFGAPTTTLPTKHAWLGALELDTEELPSGAFNMGARSYVPGIGRFLEPDPHPGGSANAYAYTFDDPVNSFDPSGELTWGLSGQELGGAEAVAGDVVTRELAREEAARRAAEEATRATAEEAAIAAGPQYNGGEEEWEEEEGGYEYAADHQGTEGDGQEAHVESAILELKGSTFGPQIETALGGVHDAEQANVRSTLTLCGIAASRATRGRKLCAQYVDVFSEIGKGLSKGWGLIKKGGTNLYHKGVRLLQWARKEQCEYLQRAGCNQITNTATSCEVAGASLWASGFFAAGPALSWLIRAAGTADYFSC